MTFFTALPKVFSLLCLGFFTVAYAGSKRVISKEIVEWSSKQSEYLSMPKSVNKLKFPAVVLMHGCSGLEPAVLNGLKSHAHFFNSEGYVTFIVDSFGLRGKVGGLVCDSFEELASARKFRFQDALRASEFLKSLEFVDSNNVFLIGQSNGGSVALSIAAGQDKSVFQGVAAYYPWCGQLSNKLQIPLLVLGAENDAWVSPKGCKDKEGWDFGVKFKAVIYENAEHSFDLAIKHQEYSGRKVGGDSLALDKSRLEILNWFKSLER